MPLHGAWSYRTEQLDGPFVVPGSVLDQSILPVGVVQDFRLPLTDVFIPAHHQQSKIIICQLHDS